MIEDQSKTWDAKYFAWLDYVVEWARTYERGLKIPIGPSDAPLELPATMAGPAAGAKVLVCAPHPDDEALIGALPLRLRLENGARVADVAITLGSNLAERPRRLRELESACRVLGFGLEVPRDPSGSQGFDQVRLKTRQEHPQLWAEKVEVLAQIFDAQKPDVVFAPHCEDFNTAHIGTHYLVTDALGLHLERSGRGPIPLIETEFWHEHSAPNLMVGLTPELVAIQILATAEHGGEVGRNPYHLRQPARLMNNVRRGSEVVGGQGGPAHPFLFAELYRITFMRGKNHISPRAGGRIVTPRERIDLGELAAAFLPPEHS